MKKCYIKFPNKTDKDNRAIYMFCKFRGFPHHYEGDELVFENTSPSDFFREIIERGLEKLKNRYEINVTVEFVDEKCYIKFLNELDKDNRNVCAFCKACRYPHHYDNDVLVFENTYSDNLFCGDIERGVENLKNRYKINTIVRYE